MPPSDEEIDRVHSVIDYYEKHEFEVLNEFDEKKMTEINTDLRAFRAGFF